MKLRTALLAATVFAAPAAAIAQPITGPYVSLGVGANYIGDQDIRDFNVPALGAFSPGNNGHLTSNTDVMGSAAFGYGLGNGIRIELQGDYRQNGLKSFGGLSASGQEQTFGGFVNALYDFDLTPFGLPLSPYLGVGAGYEQLKFSNGAYSGFGGANGTDAIFIREINTKGEFAAQGIAGVAFNIAAVPGLALTVEGRVMGLPQDQPFHGQFFASSIGNASYRAYYKLDNTIEYSGLVGLRYALFQPPLPPRCRRRASK